MHYGLSNVIIRDQNFAKVCKSKTLLVAHFWTKRAQIFSKRSRTAKIYNKYFLYIFWWKNGKILAYNSKNLKGWSHKLETLHAETLGIILKKPWKLKNCGGSPSLWNLHLKYTNIFHFFHDLDQSNIIWIHFLRALVNWSLQFDSHSFRCLFESQLILWQFNCWRNLFSTHTQI